MKILLLCTRRPGTTKVGGDLGQAFAELGHEVAYYDFDDRPFALRAVPKPRIARAGREHFLAHHSYKGRAQRILDVVASMR
jgi:hypothetical protein